MDIRTVDVELVGRTPLIMHKSNIEWEDAFRKWLTLPENKKNSRAGDDRTPGWSWIGGLYHDGEHVVMPSDNIMSLLREGGTKVGTGRGKETFKRQSQSGIIVMDPYWKLVTSDGRLIPYSKIEELVNVDDYEPHQAAVRQLGFDLLVKSVRLNKKRHIRVRPIFAKGWRLGGQISLIDDSITRETFENILTFAGRYSGIGDWRPSSPDKPGSHGQFDVTFKW